MPGSGSASSSGTWTILEKPRGLAAGGPYALISGRPSGGNVLNRDIPLTPARAAACASCPRGCRMRLATGDSNESVCAGTMVINVEGSVKFTRQGNDLMQKYGLGHWQLMPLMSYVQTLYKEGVLGKGKQLDTNLPLDQAGNVWLRRSPYEADRHAPGNRQ